VRRLAVFLTLLAAATGCGDDDPPDRAAPEPPPEVQRRTKPVWCPAPRYEQVRRGDGRYDVERLPHGTFDARELLGETTRQAERLAKRNECSLRVVVRDGERLVTTQDLRPNRINVSVRRGYVTALQSVG
jgi:hypothetical protein